MLDRKIYQLSQEGKDVWIYLRDQGRWLERARILDIQGETILVRYETEDEDEICSWEELLRLDSIGGVAQRLSTIPKGLTAPTDLLVSDECPAEEMLKDPALDPSDDLDTASPGNTVERDPVTEPLLRSQEEGQSTWDSSSEGHE